MLGVLMLCAWKLLPVYGGGTFMGSVISPSEPNVWYCWVDMAGPYRSDDSGEHWRPVFKGFSPDQDMLLMQRMRSISLDPRDPDKFVMAGGDFSDRPGGLLVTTDGGKSFRTAIRTRFYGDAARKKYGSLIDRDPEDPDRLVCAPEWDGVFISEDNGESWKPCGLDGGFFTFIAFDKADSKRVYTASFDLGDLMSDGPREEMVDNFRFKPMGPHRERGFYRSEDGGRTWSKIAETGPAEMLQLAGDKRIIGIFNEKTIKYSDDGCETWKDMMDGLPKFEIYQTDYEWTPLLHNGRYYAAAAGKECYYLIDTAGTTYRLAKGSTHWEKIPFESAKQSYPENAPTLVKHRRLRMVSSLFVDPADDNHLLAGDWYNLWETKNGGRNWLSKNRGIQPLCSFVLGFDPFEKKHLLYGVADMGLFYSPNRGKTLEPLEDVIGAACTFAYSTKTSGLVYTAGGRENRMKILRSRDHGKTWETPALKGLPPLTEKLNSCFNLGYDPKDDALYATITGQVVEDGDAGIYRSLDEGENWEFFSNGISDPTLFQKWRFQYFHNQFAFSPDGTAIFVGLNGIPYRLNREKRGWEVIPSLHLRVATAPSDAQGQEPFVVADPNVPGRFLIPARGDAPGLFESLDGGKTFTRITSITGYVYDIAFDARIPGRVYVAQRGEIMRSDDGGKHFCTLKGGMDLPRGAERRIAADDGRLYFHAYGAGVWATKVND